MLLKFTWMEIVTLYLGDVVIVNSPGEKLFFKRVKISLWLKWSVHDLMEITMLVYFIVKICVCFCVCICVCASACMCVCVCVCVCVSV